MNREQELKFLEELEKVPMLPNGSYLMHYENEVHFAFKPFLEFVKKLYPDAKFYNNDRMRKADWDKLYSKMDYVSEYGLNLINFKLIDAKSVKKKKKNI